MRETRCRRHVGCAHNGHVADAAQRSSSGRWPAAARMAAIAAIVALSLVVIGTARQDPLLDVEWSAPRALVALGLAGCAAMVLAAWLLCRARPLASIGLAVTVAGLLAPSVSGWTSMSTSIRAACLAVVPLALIGIGWIARAWDPAGGRGTFAVVVTLSLAAVLLHWAGYNPFDDTACDRICANVSPIAGGIVSTRRALMSSQALSVAAGVVLILFVLWSRNSRPPSVTVGAVVATSVLAFAAARRWTMIGDARLSPKAELVPSVIAATAIGSTMCVVAVTGRRTRRAIERLAGRLAEPEAVLFGRPLRGMHVVVPGDGRWIDLAGGNVSAEPNGPALVVSDESGPTMRLLLVR